MYDVIIIGCGPAGMTAAIYLLRANKKILMLEKETIGGAITSSPLVENYPGFQSISGTELMDKMYEQIMNLGATIELSEVIKIENGKTKKVITEDNVYETKSIIIATGTKNRLLGLDKEEEFIGNGISFCVACDGAFYKDKVVAVIGGGNSALTNALSLSEIAKKVYLIQKTDKLTAEDVLISRVNNKTNIEIFMNSNVIEYIGKDSLEKIKIKIKINSEEKIIQLDGLFLAIGQIPETEFTKNIISLDSYNYINSNDTKTNIDGIFVAGDCRKKKVRQLTTAINDGTISAIEVLEYLSK